MKDEDEKDLENVPTIIVYCLNKAEELLHNQKFIRSFLFGIFAIVIAFFLAVFYRFMKPVILIIGSVVVMYILMYWLGIR